MGTVTKTIGTNSRNYSTMQGWEDALPANLVTDGNSQVGECYNDSEFTGTLLISGETTDATHTITLTAAAGQSFRDHASAATNPLRYDASKGVGVRKTTAYNFTVQVDVDYVTISKIQIGHTGGGNSARCLSAANNTTANNAYKNLLLQASSSQYTAFVRCGVFVNSAVICLSGGSSVGVGVSYPVSLTLANLTIIAASDATSSGAALEAAAAGATVKNCAMFGYATSANNASRFSGNNNASNQAIGFGTSNQASLTYTSQFNGTTAAAMDASPKSGGALNTNGVRDATNTADLDIIGVSRSTSTPTIGAREYTAIGGGVTGTLAATLGALTGSSAATASASGQSAKTLAGATMASAGTVTSTGQAAVALAGMALAATGTIANPAASYSTYTGNETPTFIGNDSQAAVLGQRFKALQSGYIFGARFYNPTAAMRTLYLYDQIGNSSAPVIAQVNSTTAAGWQDVLFSSPVAADTVKEYTLTYLTPAPGQYTTFAAKGQYDYQDIDSVNSYFDYSAVPVSPQNQYSSDGYGIAPLFSTTLTGPSPIVGTLSANLAGMGISSVGAASVSCGAAGNLGAMIAAAVASVANKADLSLTFAAVTVQSAAATGTPAASASLNAQLAPMSVSVAGASGVTASAASSLEACSITSTASTGRMAQAAITMGGMTLAASGGILTVAGAQIVLGSLQLVARGSGEIFTPSAARTFRFTPENRSYLVQPENRKFKFCA